MFNIISHKYIFLTISGLLVLLSLAAIGVWGLKPGLDFTGGSLLEVEFSTKIDVQDLKPDNAAIKKSLGELGLDNVLVQPSGEKVVILRFKEVDEPTHQKILQILGSSIKDSVPVEVSEKRFVTIGPIIGAELKRRSLWALALALLAIVFYIAWAFRRVSKPVSSWKYGLAALTALMHDIIIPTGVFSALGHFKNVEVDVLFITALLTILGFSVHDTIVVFDRIRENLSKLKSPEPYESIVNRSVNETISRSVNTSLTVLLVLTAIFFFGGETVKYFSLVLILGIIFGTYSSIFVASPLLVIWHSWTKNK